MEVQEQKRKCKRMQRWKPKKVEENKGMRTGWKSKATSTRQRLDVAVVFLLCRFEKCCVHTLASEDTRVGENHVMRLKA